MTNVVYHVAPGERHDLIKERGIAPAAAHEFPQQFSISGTSHVYFWRDVESAEHWRSYYGTWDAEIWECKAPKTFEADPNNPMKPAGSLGAFRTAEVLNPISVWEG